jgi:hypothetical protein
MKKIGLLVVLVGYLAGVVNAAEDMSKQEIKVEYRLNAKGKKVPYMFINGVLVHETDPAKQPQPPVVTPGTCSTPDKAGTAPSDAVVLFDGSQESMQKNWTDEKGKPTKWKFVDGAMESVKKAGMIQSKQKFGSCQLHVEWAAPNPPKGKGQARGNSGVFLQGIYEVQVLDCFNNKTYPDGQTGALYGRSKPLVNACRKPGEWQTYDIIYHRPLFKGGKLIRRATFTVLHNGVLVQDHLELSGGTGWRGPHAVTGYSAHGDKGPIKLQDHGNPVHYRNVWVRELAD